MNEKPSPIDLQKLAHKINYVLARHPDEYWFHANNAGGFSVAAQPSESILKTELVDNLLKSLLKEGGKEQIKIQADFATVPLAAIDLAKLETTATALGYKAPDELHDKIHDVEDNNFHKVRGAIRTLKNSITGDDPAMKLMAVSLLLGTNDPHNAQVNLSNLSRTVNNVPALTERLKTLQDKTHDLDLS